MNNNTVRMIMQINSDDTNHLARMLILLDAFSTRRSGGSINGITKLAIYTFLLKYPIALVKMIDTEKKNGKDILKKYNFNLQKYETNSIEVQMMPLNFAPWDYEYRREISILSSKKLIFINQEKKKVKIGITNTGQTAVNKLYTVPFYQELRSKSLCIKSLFGNWSEAKLVDSIYTVFPEILQSKIEMDVTI